MLLFFPAFSEPWPCLVIRAEGIDLGLSPAERGEHGSEGSEIDIEDRRSARTAREHHALARERVHDEVQLAIREPEAVIVAAFRFAVRKGDGPFGS